MGYSSLENAAFELNHPKWGKILIVCNEFAPRDEVLVWTRELISNDKYKNYKVIYLTEKKEAFNALGNINHGEDI